MKTLLKNSLVLSVILLSNAYCTNNNDMIVQIEEKNSSDFDTEYLQDMVQNNTIYYNDITNKYSVFDKQSLQKITFSKQQLSNTFNEILTNTDEKIINTSVVKAKFSIAEPFYRIMYNPQKLFFILENNDLNTFNTINNIVNKLKPLCKEYAIANLGPKSILYGIQTLEGTLPTINNQFINGLNFQFDFTKTSFFNSIGFLECYTKMISEVPTIDNCIDFALLNKLITAINYYINVINYFKDCINNNTSNYALSSNDKNNNIITAIDKRISIIRNLYNFFKINRDYIIENFSQIISNSINIFKELLNKQLDEVNINELLNQFFNKLENINNFPENERQEILKAFIESVICERICSLIILLEDKKIINKLNYFLNKNDIKQFDFNILFANYANKIWDETIYKSMIPHEIIEKFDNNGKNLEKEIQIEKRLEIYYENWIMFCNDMIHININPIINKVKKNKNNNIKELKNTILEYLLKTKNYFLNEAKKCAIFIDNKQSLVSNNFWKQKQINLKNH